MPKAAPSKRSARRRAEAAPRVAVVGAGLAGLTAALRLSQRGFEVTVFEAKDNLGGNFSSSNPINGVYHDVYPHMFCDWYRNFWDLLENDLGLKREDLFEPRNGVKLLEKGQTEYLTLQNASTMKALIANLKSGLLPPPEMFLLGFSMLDLASHAFNRSGGGVIDRLDVNAFIYSRGYSTEAVARLQNYMLMVIWSIQSDLTAAASYQDFVKHALTFPRDIPFAWLLKGSLYEKIILPFKERLDCDVRTLQPVRKVELVEDRVRLIYEPPVGTKPKGATESETFDYVVLAVPGAALADLIMEGDEGARIVDRVPRLSGLQRFQSVAIPVVDLYFKRKLPGIPREQVAFGGSDCDLSMLDISQLWTDDPNMKGITALVLAASDGCGLPSLEPDERAHMMVKRLHDYLPIFAPGKHWRDPDSDIDWEKTQYHSNDQHKLFVNDVGSWEWRPFSAYPEALPNVAFAGDYCQTDVDMATVEAAVESGLQAAQAIQAQDASVNGGRLRGAPIQIAPHEIYSDTVFQAAKLALLPLAYASSAWAAVLEQMKQKKDPMPPDTYSPMAGMILLPAEFTLDWWRTVYWLARSVWPTPLSKTPPSGDHRDIQPPDVLIGLGETILSTVADVLQEFSQTQPSRDEAKRESPLAAAFATFANQAVRTAQVAYTQATGSAGVAPKRRARIKP